MCCGAHSSFHPFISPIGAIGHEILSVCVSVCCCPMNCHLLLPLLHPPKPKGRRFWCVEVVLVIRCRKLASSNRFIGGDSSRLLSCAAFSCDPRGSRKWKTNCPTIEADWGIVSFCVAARCTHFMRRHVPAQTRSRVLCNVHTKTKVHFIKGIRWWKMVYLS